jgi:hypothetical protein
MTLCRSLGVLATTALTLTAAACTGHGYGRGHTAGFRSGGDPPIAPMVMRDPVARLLDHQAVLRLTLTQVNGLIAIEEKLQADNRPLRDRLAELRPPRHRHEGRQAVSDSSMTGARMAQRDSAATVWQTLRENEWRATNAAYAQLTDEQMRAAALLESHGGLVGRDGRGQPHGPRGAMPAPGGPPSPGEG